VGLIVLAPRPVAWDGLGMPGTTETLFADVVFSPFVRVLGDRGETVESRFVSGESILDAVDWVGLDIG
jgi:hypothetical protein